jgi:hypothetical protein
MEKIDMDFITVRDYIYDNKHASMDKVSEDTGVSKQIIMHLLKEGRLIIDDPDGGGGVLFCESCKKPISTGRMCKECKDKVATSMQKNITSNKPAPPPKTEAPTGRGAAKLQS